MSNTTYVQERNDEYESYLFEVLGLSLEEIPREFTDPLVSDEEYSMEIGVLKTFPKRKSSKDRRYQKRKRN